MDEEEALASIRGKEMPMGVFKSKRAKELIMSSIDNEIEERKRSETFDEDTEEFIFDLESIKDIITQGKCTVAYRSRIEKCLENDIQHREKFDRQEKDLAIKIKYMMKETKQGVLT
jgi:hypothetical protein